LVLGGFAEVRRCAAEPGGHILGLEFSAPLARCRKQFAPGKLPAAAGAG